MMDFDGLARPRSRKRLIGDDMDTPGSMRGTLLLRREDAALAMSEAQRLPWLCVGFDSAMLPIMLDPPPPWIPQAGDRMPSSAGSLLVLRRALIQPRTAWPWLLCAVERKSCRGSYARMDERSSSIRDFSHFSRRAFVYCALLCWRAGRSRSTVDEQGATLRLVTAQELARAAMAMAPLPSLPLGPGAKIASFRAKRIPDQAGPQTLPATAENH